jgi:hypothetical protein
MAASATSFQKGKSGNPAGRKAGSRNRASLAVDALLDGDAERLARAAIDLALAGDATAMRLCLDRIAPVRKDRPINFVLPPIETTADLTKATASLLTAVAAGDLTPSEAAELGKLVDAHVKAIEVTDIQGRLERLEKARP